MSRNFYSEIHLHLVWHCKDSSPLLTPTLEIAAHNALRTRLIKTEGVFVHEIGGTATHVHAAITVHPTITPSVLIGQLKGGSSHDVNHSNPTRDKLLEWQSGYGIVSFGTRNLPWVQEYIRRQKEHHATGNAIDRFERITTND